MTSQTCGRNLLSNSISGGMCEEYLPVSMGAKLADVIKTLLVCGCGVYVALSAPTSFAKDPQRDQAGRVSSSDIDADAEAIDPDAVVGAGADLDTGEGDLPDKGESAARRAVLKGADEVEGDNDSKDDERLRAAANQVVITNSYGTTVYYQLRVGNGSWINYSLRPNVYKTHPATGTLSVRFDWSFASGFQARQYTLVSGTDNEFRSTYSNSGIDLFQTSSGGSSPVCNNTCRYRFDGECDDGGPGSDYSLCTLGSDTADCGSRCGSTYVPAVQCYNTCLWAFDGECDDGGVGSDYNLCPRGTDCADCGAR